MPQFRSVKKSETLEVRLPYELKSAFMNRCREGGGTASDAVRRFIERDLEAGPKPRRVQLRWWQAMLIAAGGLAVGAVAAPSLAQPAPMSKAAFDRLDRNHDGVLSYDEFRGR
jgi:hypothetical protein